MRPFFASLADAILVLHAIVVLFNVGALPVIWVGYFRGWGFVRNSYLRIAHLLLIGVVAAEAVFGMICPLTSWEAALRSEPKPIEGFIAYWIHRLLFYDAPAWVFTTAYLLFFVLVVVTFIYAPPQFLKSRRGHP
ncbi:MAG: DUF2784 domain-containing protein [Verrucomicrobiia bacterium]